MDTRELHEQGLKLRKRIFGDQAVEARMRALGDFGAPLQHIINAYAYGDIWSRPGLDNKIRSLVVLGMTAALNRPAEFGVHVRGARANGCSAEEIREVLLLIAMYCGIPAANDAHRLALEAMGLPGGRPRVKIAVRPLLETDLVEADRVFRLAFGTEFGLPEPTAFRGDSDLVKTRWRADPRRRSAPFAATS